jgi:eukaryotic-like serine/threonine-protein kinase
MLGSDLKQGDVVAGKYIIEGEIGAGGMGRVYAATNAAIAQKVAIKVLREDVSKVAGVTARFVREARAIASISSEYVGRIYDAGTLPGEIPYIVMERLTGETLSSLVRKKGPMPLYNALVVLSQVSEALAEAHSLGIVHRDVKPANIFVSTRFNGKPHAKILDFGISKVATRSQDEMELTTTGIALGTPLYMSPEQIKDAALAGPATDIWALGVTLYYALSKKHPFSGENSMFLAVSISSETHVPLAVVAPGLPESAYKLVDSCLSKKPEHRPTIQGFSEALEALMDEAKHLVTAERPVMPSVEVDLPTQIMVTPTPAPHQPEPDLRPSPKPSTLARTEPRLGHSKEAQAFLAANGFAGDVASPHTPISLAHAPSVHGPSQSTARIARGGHPLLLGIAAAVFTITLGLFVVVLIRQRMSSEPGAAASSAEVLSTRAAEPGPTNAEPKLPPTTIVTATVAAPTVAVPTVAVPTVAAPTTSAPSASSANSAKDGKQVKAQVAPIVRIAPTATAKATKVITNER